MQLTCLCLVVAAVSIVLSKTGIFKPEIEIKDGQAPLALPDFIEESGILYPIIENVTLAAGETKSEIILHNHDGNTCNLTFELILTDTGETLYLSEPVPPSGYIREQKLTRGLPEGNYEAEIIIRAYDPEDQTELRTKTVPIELDVQP